ncbi:hypothetical protein JQX13_33790 [Archangium violaceum]|uniref:hypothetical protein n=1 Tax=Archangium violaceum TaxID=83451 RepID=UPI00193B1F1D|nr:hypothetical protein [Archangium violaceum]QRK05149.1 hypothetical protein JQX13_33790 [Archangium violaceum]
MRTSDPVVRNLRITQAYHDLSVALSGLFGVKNVSWCAHATWASKTAGGFIRKEEVPELLGHFLERADATTRGFSNQPRFQTQTLNLGFSLPTVGLQTVLTRTIERIADDIAHHIARGNVLVFAELGPLYVEMLARFGGGAPPEQDALNGLLARLRPGPVDQGGQELLIQAFTHYHQALHAQEPKARAELIFLANALVGFHEQARLQEAIVAALNAPFRDVFLQELSVSLGLRVSLRGASGQGPGLEVGVRALFEPLSRWFERLWRELSTRAFMRIELPDVALKLGEDIPALTAERDFPPELNTLTHPGLMALLARLDRTPNDTQGSAARDWGNLNDRMNYIVDLFRTRQQDRLLYDQPFTYLQVESFRQGRVPHGRL